MQRAFKRQQRGEVKVLPILLRPVALTDLSFAHVALVPTNGQAVTLWENQDAAWTHITEAIRCVLEGKPLPMVQEKKGEVKYTKESYQASYGQTIGEHNEIHHFQFRPLRPFFTRVGISLGAIVILLTSLVLWGTQRWLITNGSQVFLDPPCPLAGLTHTATVNSSALLGNRGIVYIVNEGSRGNTPSGALERYDIKGESSSEIVRIASAVITDAQISKDGQWILFIVKESGQSKLEVIRVDGQKLQTLYCTSSVESLSDVQWSTDKTRALFALYNANDLFLGVSLLDLPHGVLQPALLSDECLAYHPSTWFNDNQIYMLSNAAETATCSPWPGGGIEVSLFDVNKGANQNDDNLQHITEISDATMSIAINPESKQLFISNSGIDKYRGVHKGNSSISMLSATGGNERTIYSSSTLAVTELRVISNTTLLLLMSSVTNTTGQDGLWRIDTNGSNLTHLTTTNEIVEMNNTTQDSWSNASSDGSLYTVQTSNQDGSSALQFGSTKGGPLTAFFSAPIETELAIVGWM